MEKDFNIWLMKNREELYKNYEIYVEKLLDEKRAYMIKTWGEWTTDRFLDELAEQK